MHYIKANKEKHYVTKPSNTEYKMIKSNIIMRVFLVLMHSLYFSIAKLDRNKLHINGNINEKDVNFLLSETIYNMIYINNFLTKKHSLTALKRF